MPRGSDEIFEEFARAFVRRHGAGASRVERILVAMDFSLCALRALAYGEELARKFGAELILVHAEGISLVASETGNVGHAVAERELARVVDQLRAEQLEVRGLLRPGSPAEEILNTAETERVSVIVVGTHGRSGLADVLLGSVAERVVRSAPCPVLTVGPGKRV
jgi:nucleotide-binding universal stress UspA family protein